MARLCGSVCVETPLFHPRLSCRRVMIDHLTQVRISQSEGEDDRGTVIVRQTKQQDNGQDRSCEQQLEETMEVVLAFIYLEILII